jgi:hypothetical protein
MSLKKSCKKLLAAKELRQVFTIIPPPISEQRCFGIVPDTGEGSCLGPGGNGVSLGEGGEGGPNPPGGVKDRQSVLSKGRDNMGKNEEDWASRT